MDNCSHFDPGPWGHPCFALGLWNCTRKEVMEKLLKSKMFLWVGLAFQGHPNGPWAHQNKQESGPTECFCNLNQYGENTVDCSVNISKILV